MKRRTFIGAAIASLATATFYSRPLRAIDLGVDSPPFNQVGPFPGDVRTVYEFLSFNCPHCQEYHASMASWGKSLPQPIRFEPIPVAVNEESFRAARAYYAVRLIAPKIASDFLLAGLDETRRTGSMAALWNGQVAERVGVPPKDFTTAANNLKIKDSIQKAVEKTMRYRIEATPSLAIGGQWVIHADHVNGDYGMLMRIASGLVSRVMDGGKA